MILRPDIRISQTAKKRGLGCGGVILSPSEPLLSPLLGPKSILVIHTFQSTLPPWTAQITPTRPPPMLQVQLPEGSSSPAFTALCGYASCRCAPNPAHEVRWRVSDLDGAAKLLCTADFLLLADLIPELAALCHAHVRGPADVAALQALSVSHAAVQALVQQLQGTALSATLTPLEITSMLSQMQTHPPTKAQTLMLVRWLRQGQRTLEDIAAVCGAFGLETWTSYDRTTKCMQLKAGAKELVEKLVALAVDRRALYFPILPAILRCPPLKSPERTQPVYTGQRGSAIAILDHEDLHLPGRPFWHHCGEHHTLTRNFCRMTRRVKLGSTNALRPIRRW